MDYLREDLRINHNQIHVVDFDFYNTELFNRCENGNDVLIAVERWANVHPLLRIIPVEWEYSVPYGLFYSPEPSQTVSNFLSAVHTVLNS